MTLLTASLIRTDGGSQPRALIDITVVEDYADQISRGAMFPPVVVYHDGEHYWLGDGYHRYHARVDVLGEAEIEADIRMGTRRDAVLHAVGANAEHGLRRTNEDKRRAVMMLLGDDEWSQWSDREVARQCAVSQPFVTSLRGKPSDNSLQMRTVQRGETTYRMDTSRIGRRTEPVEDECGDWSPNVQRCPSCGQVLP